MTSSLLRELREEDAEQVAALFVEAFGGARKLDAREVASWLRDPDLQPREPARCRGRRPHRRRTATSRRVATSCSSTSPHRVAGPSCSTGPKDRSPILGLKTASLYRPARARARAHRRSPRLREAPRVADDGDRLRRAAARRRLRRARAAHVPRRRPRRRDRCAQRCVLRGSVLPGSDSREVQRASSSARHDFDPALWFLAWDGDELAGLRARLSAARDRRRPRSRQLARRPQAVAPARSRRSAAPTARSASCTRAASTGQRSASTRRTSPARCACTNASACTRRIRFGTWQKDL